MTKRVFGVVLYDEAFKELGSLISDYTHRGPTIDQFIYAEKVDTTGNYCLLVVKTTSKTEKPFTAEIQIPHRYVKFIIAGDDKKRLGFDTPRPRSSDSSIV